MEIVQATPYHIEFLTPLFDQYRQFYRQGSDPEGGREFLLDRMKRRESIVYLALQDGRAVGFVQLYPCFSSTSMKRLWILNDLFVSPTARRSGIGKALIARARELAIENQCQGTSAFNRNPQYQRAGAVRTSRVPPGYGFLPILHGPLSFDTFRTSRTSLS